MYIGYLNQYVTNTEALVQQEFTDEHMYNLNKDQIINETQTQNDSKLSDKNSSIILVKLIYLANQGIQFNEEEVEQLICRITKLFQSNNSRLRQMTYISLKMIMPQKYVHILIQCLNKEDLKSSNPYIKQQALKFIPFIQGEQYIQQIERFIHDALLDQNLLILSTALLDGIHIINKFPNLVGKCQRLEEPKENLDYHVLILFHEIKLNIIYQYSNGINQEIIISFTTTSNNQVYSRDFTIYSEYIKKRILQLFVSISQKFRSFESL